MASPGFDEEAAERWMQSRAGVRHADPADPMARFRNTSRSMFVDRKSYTGGALRGAVSDRRAEWMGGGAGGRMGEDWRQHQMIDVDRHGSGLDPFSYSIVKGVRNKTNKFRQRRAARRVLGSAPAEEEGPVEESSPTSTVEPTTPVETPGKPKRVMTPEQRMKSNERRRALTAQRRDAVGMLAAYSLGDESPSGPMWSGGPTP